ncbi:lanthionine synthetase C family protein [Streptomyces sp. NBC_00158]|uniref:lanthionine synthetase C family protein n=1 Tax=Streptomyces sp. NBC_00158 TaxID=2903627 RepID=UPI002F9177CC
MSEQTRLTARAVADALADRLADPRAIPVGDLPGESRHVNVSEVEAGTLGRGHSGISLLFSSRATGNSAAAAHGHLQRCSQLLRKLPQPGIGMQAHLTGLGFAMLAARTATGGYGQALAQLDGHICRAAEVLCAPATAGSRELDRFDAISGLTGIGRYLLLRGEPVVRTTEKVLDRLTSMALEGTGPSASAGGDLPAFWADEPPSPYFAADSDVARHGHLNLGLAHGIPGPLVLLSLAHAQGIRRPGLPEAVERLSGLLVDWVQYDAYGPFWPGYLSRSEFLTGTLAAPRTRQFRWCYDVPGVARALQIAGRATDRSDWTALAGEAVAAALSVPVEEWGETGMGVCHGWAGVLHLLGHFTDGPHATAVRAARDDIATRITDGFDEAFRFGYRPAHADNPHGGDYPGLLDGAAGIALALDSYADEGRQAFPWDAAFLAA